ncbi:MAG: hypothetical protein AUJ97_01655 [Bacteroidetes bacterium CG2_30_32_10]|nr:MAG: hypothetical protein AUJ97_01655 [Bacteroidetes bacterium CG2_30_32_10]
MKKQLIISFLFVFAVFFSLTSNLVAQNSLAGEVSNAIKNGNSKDLAKNFYSSIDLTVPGNEGTFSKSQAELIVKDFFTKNPPKSFAINHQGTSADGSQYSIGTYTSSSIAYRTYFIIKKFSDTYYIQQIQFEQQ